MSYPGLRNLEAILRHELANLPVTKLSKWIFNLFIANSLCAILVKIFQRNAFKSWPFQLYFNYIRLFSRFSLIILVASWPVPDVWNPGCLQTAVC